MKFTGLQQRPVRKLGALLGLAVALCLIMAADKCGSAHNAATAVNKYANSISAIQKAEVKWHHTLDANGNARIDAATDERIQKAFKVATAAGRHLDAGIVLANQGTDPGQYIDEANKSFQDLQSLLSLTPPDVQQEVNVLVTVSADLLKNAISLIQQIKPSKPAPQGQPFAMWIWFLPLAGMVAGADGIGRAISLLNAVVGLEPTAFDFVLSVAQNLKDKTTEEITAMSDKIFSDVDATADAEIAADQKN